MPAIRFKGVDYTTPTVYVQSDASATDLENTKVPTGQTIKSYLNSNNATQSLSYTFYNGFALKSWGAIRILKRFGFLYVGFWGLYNTNTWTEDKLILKVSGLPAGGGYGVVTINNEKSAAIFYQNGDLLIANCSYVANSNIFGSMVIPLG